MMYDNGLIKKHKWHEFKDPVVADDGHTYEKKEIEQWLETHDTSPTTGRPLSKTLRPNLMLKSLIEARDIQDEAKRNAAIGGALADPVGVVEIQEPIVIAPQGQSFGVYQGIVESLKKKSENPVTRTSLEQEQLVSNLTLQTAIAELKAEQKLKAQQEKEKQHAVHHDAPPVQWHRASPTTRSSGSAASSTQQWVSAKASDRSPLSSERKKNAEKWIDEIRRDAKKQSDSNKKILLYDLAYKVERAIAVISDPHATESAKDEAEEAVQKSIEDIKSMRSTFEHVEKEKYSARRILLAVATLGISVKLGLGLKKEVLASRSAEQISAELESKIKPSRETTIGTRVPRM